MIEPALLQAGSINNHLQGGFRCCESHRISVKIQVKPKDMYTAKNDGFRNSKKAEYMLNIILNNT